jgi:hypothetical protein
LAAQAVTANRVLLKWLVFTRPALAGFAGSPAFVVIRSTLGLLASQAEASTSFTTDDQEAWPAA